jgi:putative ABC transport system permease protein
VRTLLGELRFAGRALRKSPGFVVAAVLTLSLGIGANTAIFSLIDNVFLKALAFSRPDELVRLVGDAPERNLSQLPFSMPKFKHFREGQTAFAGFAADNFGGNAALTGEGDPVQLNTIRVTGNYFAVVGVQPILGRVFRPDEEDRGPDVVMLSEGFWQAHFGRDPHVIGRLLNLDGQAYSIIGVVPTQPPAYYGPLDVWMTHPFETGVAADVMNRGYSFLRVIARMPSVMTVSQATAAAAALARSYKSANPEKADSTWNSSVVSVYEDAVGNLEPEFRTLLGAVVLVLLIASCNVANLLLVRFAARDRETAVRSALGGTRARVVRQFLAESVLVTLIAAAAGVGLASGALRVAPGLDPTLPVNGAVGVNIGVLALTLGVALATGVLMGLYPALQASRPSMIDVLKTGGRSQTASRGQHRFRSLLLGGQVAVSFVLVLSALLLVTSFARLHRQTLGFTPDGRVLGFVNLSTTKYPDLARQSQFDQQLVDALRAQPGVLHAALGVGVPFAGGGRTPYARDGADPTPYPKRPLGLSIAATPGYFATLGIPIVAGRDFAERDRPDAPPVAIISQATAKRVFGTENPIGQRMLIGSLGGGRSTEVVGLAADIHSGSLARVDDVAIYRPLSQFQSPFVQVIVHTAAGDVSTATAVVRAALRAVDPQVAFTQARPYTTAVGNSVSGQRQLMTLLGGFATVALLLAAVGIYSVVAFMLGQRTTEIGVRLALGAERRAVLGLMIRQSMWPVVVGVIVGLMGALAVARLLQSQLFGTSALEPLMIAAPTALLLSVGLVASWIPAFSACRLGPMAALRQ